jgi:hypothetical protein
MNLRDRSAELGTTLRIEDDHGVIDLPPLPARAAPPHAAPPDPPLGSPPAPWPAPPADCVVPAVPDEARIEPLAIGPLILLGVSVEPRELTEETRLRLDTYWQVDAPLASDLSLAVQIEPLPRNGLSWGDDHEPCDWMWPTSRWTPGTIYRDRCDLLPPSRPRQRMQARAQTAQDTLIAAELVVRVGLRRLGEPVESERLVTRLPCRTRAGAGLSDDEERATRKTTARQGSRGRRRNGVVE